MSGPCDRNHEEANQECDERRADFAESVRELLTSCEIRNLNLQHEQGDDDREDSVRKGHHPGGIVAAIEAPASTSCIAHPGPDASAPDDLPAPELGLAELIGAC